MEGDRVGELTTTIRERLSDAYDSLRTARDTGDDLLAEAQRADIDDLRRIAARHGIDVPNHA
jgi:propanediol dehydratase small subunit